MLPSLTAAFPLSIGTRKVNMKRMPLSFPARLPNGALSLSTDKHDATNCSPTRISENPIFEVVGE
jgi:hypothetical protein